jgi:hypothetical protein
MESERFLAVAGPRCDRRLGDCDNRPDYCVHYELGISVVMNEHLHGGNSMGLYVLDGHEPVAIDDTLEWARWYEQSDKRRVAQTSINGWRVSTVFLGIDNNLLGGKPLLFETLIFSETETVKSKLLNREFRKTLDNYCIRYVTWDEAMKGHEEAVAYVREGLM